METGEVVQQENFQPVPTGEGSLIDFTPLSDEQLKNLLGEWSPGLGGKLIGMAQKGKQALDLQAPLELSDAENRDYGFLNEASYAERLNGEGGDRKEKFKQWVMNSKNPIILKLSGIDPSGEITDEQAESAFQTMIGFFDSDRKNIDVDEFVDKMRGKFSLDELKQDFSSFSAFCHVFGKHAGTALAHLTVGELGIAKEEVKKEMIEKGSNLGEDEKSLMAVIKDLSQKQPEKNTGDDGNKEVGGAESLPDYAGGAIIGNRGREDSKDPRGQDRLYYKKLDSGQELFLVTDGAGREGHQVAEAIGGLLASKLEAGDGLDENKIKKILKDIHAEMQNKFGKTSGATVDGVLKTDKGNFVFHVGEGFIGEIKDGAIKNLNGIEPQNFGVGDDGLPKRTINGFKTPEIGVDAEVEPVVISGLGNDFIILASDGFSDMLPYINISIEEFNRRLKESPQKVAEYLTNLANGLAQEKHHKEADDVAVMVVDLREKDKKTG